MVTMPFHVQSLSGDADVSVYPHSEIMLKQYQLSMLLCYHRKLMYIIICLNLVQLEMHSRKIALSLEMSYSGQKHQNKKCNFQFTQLCWAKISAFTADTTEYA